MDPHLFTGIGMPLLLLSCALANVLNDGKRVWTSVALMGGACMLVAGVLYQDWSIVIVEFLFMAFNLYGFVSTYEKEAP